MNLGELKKLIENLPDDTEIWSWNDHSGYWYQMTYFQLGLQHPIHKEAIFISQEHFEEEILACDKNFIVPVNQMKKVVIL